MFAGARFYLALFFWKSFKNVFRKHYEKS